MKRPSQSSFTICLTVLLAAGALLAAGCGGDDPAPADPQEVIETAFPAGKAAAPAGTGATVEVASLGFEDSVLDSRTLEVNPKTYAQVRQAIGGDGKNSKGLFGLASDIESAGTEELDGTEVDRVTGEFNVKKLVGRLLAASETAAVAAALPGVGELTDLREQLVGATFDLYAQSEDGTFEQLDLTLSIDDRENASPPTRIRFSMRPSDSDQATN